MKEKIISGALVLFIVGIVTALANTYIYARENTEHRIKNEEFQEKILGMLKDMDSRQVRIEANQRFLISKYERDINQQH